MATQIPGAIFLHIPKCGGTWVRNYFSETKLTIREIEPEHINAHVIRTKIDPTEDLICCFVRHPLTWYCSYWQHRQVLINNRSGGPIDQYVDQSFSDFIESVLSNLPSYITNFFNGFLNRCRTIGKQEALRDDLNSILTLLRIPYNKDYLYQRPYENTTQPTVKYPTSLALEVMKQEEEIINRFNYNYIPSQVLL